MKRRMVVRTCRWFAIVVLALAPATALAQRQQEEIDPIDARLEGYAGHVSLPASSVGMVWVATIVLGALCCAGLFKDAKRSHLD